MTEPPMSRVHLPTGRSTTVSNSPGLIWIPMTALAVAPLGAQQVMNLPASDRRLDVPLEDVYVVGKIEGDAWELFGNRVEVGFDGEGNLHVFDPENHRVVVVNPSGSLLRTAGQRGEGPGELRNPAGFAVMRDGTDVVADPSQRGFVRYDPDGEYQGSVRLGGTDGVLVLGDLVADTRGTSVLSVGQRMVSISRQGRGGPPQMPTGRPIVRFPLDGAASHAFHDPFTPPAPDGPTISTEAGGTRIAFAGPMSRAFEPGLFAGALPEGGLAVSDSSAYAIKVLDAAGDIRSVIRRPIPPRPVTARIEDEERERRLRELEEGGGPQIEIAVARSAGPGGGAPVAQTLPQEQVRDMLSQQVERMTFYPEIPVVIGLATGWTDRIWVQRRGEDIHEDGPVDVLSAGGDYLGTIDPDGPGIPDAFGPDGLAAYIETDDLGVITVAVRRLPAALR